MRIIRSLADKLRNFFHPKINIPQVPQLKIQPPVGTEFIKWRNFGVCPDCGSNDQWLEGPSGGSCTNYTCDSCGAKFNVALPPLNMIQRIGSRHQVKAR